MQINIIPYADRHQPAFKQLNLEWLDAYNLTEPRDVEVLDNPRETILDTGGTILIAEENGQVVGSAALMKEHDSIYELAKMGVSKTHQGKGISKLLLEECLRQAKTLGATRI